MDRSSIAVAERRAETYIQKARACLSNGGRRMERVLLGIQGFDPLHEKLDELHRLGEALAEAEKKKRRKAARQH